MKTIIDNVGADIDTVSVDSPEIRERLLDDEQYAIDQVPTVLLLYSSGQHKKYTSKSLDLWFEQLLQNIEDYQNQQHQQQQTVLDLDNLEDPREYEQSLPPRHNGVAHEEVTSGMGGGAVVPGMGAVSSTQAAMVAQHIVGSEPPMPITSDPNIQPGRKEVKKDGLSAAALAKQMAEQREKHDEKVEEERPFM